MTVITTSSSHGHRRLSGFRAGVYDDVNGTVTYIADHLARHASRQQHPSELLFVVFVLTSGLQVRRLRRASELDEKVTHCAEIIVLTQEQAFSAGDEFESPFKSEHYHA